MTPTPGDITHRIGPSVPSPSLPARSYFVVPRAFEHAAASPSLVSTALRALSARSGFASACQHVPACGLHFQHASGLKALACQHVSKNKF